ncbi:MAG: HRDC domain-containing protein [Acholeplasmataceae bacterium]
MGLLDWMLGSDVIKGPEFVKEFNVDDNIQLNTLNQLLEKVSDESKEIIEQEIIKIKSGLSGEKNVYYELKNSRLPLVCLHDIRLEHNGYTAQFDFIIIASEFITVIETKKLYGNITIDHEGNFNREYLVKGRIFKEGMYSPITQNERHVRLLIDFLVDHKFHKVSPIYSLVVIANDKTIVNKKFAKAEVKNMIIKYDQLALRLKNFKTDTNGRVMKDSLMREIAQTILNHNNPIEYDYINMLGLKLKQEIIKEDIPVSNKTEEISKDENEVQQTRLHDDLKTYRYTKSKSMNIKPYFIFNNSELDLLVSQKPTTRDDFLNISGFGEKKYESYGEDIIHLVKSRLDSVYDELKKYRIAISKELGLKAYEVFTNQQLDDIIKIMPNDINQLKIINYFDHDRISKFGQGIIEIIKKTW